MRISIFVYGYMPIIYLGLGSAHVSMDTELGSALTCAASIKRLETSKYDNRDLDRNPD